MDKQTQNQKWPINTWQTPTLDRKVCRGPVNCSVTWLMKSSHVLFSCWSTSRLESMNSSVTWGVPCQHKTLAAHLLGCNQPAMVAFLEVWATKISASIDSVEAHEPLRVLLTVATLTLELLASLWTPTEVTVFFHGSKGNLKKCYWCANVGFCSCLFSLTLPLS